MNINNSNLYSVSTETLNTVKVEGTERTSSIENTTSPNNKHIKSNNQHPTCFKRFVPTNSSKNTLSPTIKLENHPQIIHQPIKSTNNLKQIPTKTISPQMSPPARTILEDLHSSKRPSTVPNTNVFYLNKPVGNTNKQNLILPRYTHNSQYQPQISHQQVLKKENNSGYNSLQPQQYYYQNGNIPSQPHHQQQYYQNQNLVNNGNNSYVVIKSPLMYNHHHDSSGYEKYNGMHQVSPHLVSNRGGIVESQSSSDGYVPSNVRRVAPFRNNQYVNGSPVYRYGNYGEDVVMMNENHLDPINRNQNIVYLQNGTIVRNGDQFQGHTGYVISGLPQTIRGDPYTVMRPMQSVLPTAETEVASSSMNSTIKKNKFEAGDDEDLFPLSKCHHLFPIRILAFETGLSKDPNKSWRYRDIKRALVEKVEKDHLEFIYTSKHHNVIKERLPHKLSMVGFCKRILTLVFHFIIKDGKYPKFWLRKKSKGDYIIHVVKSFDRDFINATTFDTAFEIYKEIQEETKEQKKKENAKEKNLESNTDTTTSSQKEENKTEEEKTSSGKVNIKEIIENVLKNHLDKLNCSTG